MSAAPIRIAIANDYEIVVAGVAALLAPFEDRIVIVELDSGLPVVSDVDVILYDTFGQVQGDGVDLEDLVHGTRARVIIFSWNLQPELIEGAIRRGASGYVSKALTGEQIVGAVEAVHSGKIVTPPKSEVGSTGGKANGDWPGREQGLTARE